MSLTHIPQVIQTKCECVISTYLTLKQSVFIARTSQHVQGAVFAPSCELVTFDAASVITN